MPQHHVVPSSPETCHWGYFDAGLPPVATIRSGDRVTFHCLSGGPDELPPAPFEVLPEHRLVHQRLQPKLGAHILTGPVAVEGAEPGDSLEIRIVDIELRCDWGWNVMRPWRGTLPEDFPYLRRLTIPIDRAAKTAALPWGVTLPLKPFFGVMGVAPPAAWGPQSSIEPRAFGGNIDLKELTAGSTLHLPVFEPGALLSVGDGHAIQGDGEVNLTALETCLSGTFEIHLRKGTGLAFPRAETPTHWITLGLDPDLDDAAKQALREMIKLLGELAQIAPADAYAFCSLACDLRVTQLVDGNKGVHAMMEKQLIRV
jgi:acetamidase/formamidase